MAITRILFVCHGNICRSPMAEFILKDMVSKAFISDAFEIDSAAVSREEIYRDHASNKDIGNPVYPPAKRMLMEHGIGVPGNELGVSRKRARQITEADYDRYDMIVCMDEMNVRNVRRITGADPENKLSLMLDHTSEKGGEVADPWYTGDFTASWDDIENPELSVTGECFTGKLLIPLGTNADWYIREHNKVNLKFEGENAETVNITKATFYKLKDL